MGYYTTQTGSVTILADHDETAVAALKALNHNHAAKRGGSWSLDKTVAAGGDPYATRWYSWMPPRFHEDDEMTTVGQVLEMLGYEVNESRSLGYIQYAVSYDNKTGQEDVFLARLADFAKIDVEVTGEDGERWRWYNDKAGTPLKVAHAYYEWGPPTPVAELMERQAEMERALASHRV